MLIKYLLEKLKEFFTNEGKRITIQIDNASSHIMDDDIELRHHVQLCGLYVQILKKPPQIPDLNVLDLGYFNSIQGLQQTKK